MTILEELGFAETRAPDILANARWRSAALRDRLRSTNSGHSIARSTTAVHRALLATHCAARRLLRRALFRCRRESASRAGAAHRSARRSRSERTRNRGAPPIGRREHFTISCIGSHAAKARRFTRSASWGPGDEDRPQAEGDRHLDVSHHERRISVSPYLQSSARPKMRP